jgi:undecaprenyl-diphosphatase
MPYTHYLTDLAKYVETIAIVGGYPFLFITVFLEGVPLLGSLSPGHISIVVAGFLIKIGVFNVWVTLVVALLAATLGDYLGFYVGRKYGFALIDRIKPYFFITDDHIAKVQKLLGNHSGKAMILGRMSPITRALMPFVVGATNTDEKKFWRFNILGALIWAVPSILLGYIFGAGFEVASGSTGKFIMVAVFVAIIIGWGYRFVNVRFHVFQRYELFVLALNIVSLAGLAVLMQGLATEKYSMFNFDTTVNVYMAERITQIYAWIASWISMIGGVISLSVISTIGVVMLSIKNKWRSAAIVLFSMAFAGMSIVVLKEFFARIRPLNALVHYSDPSFPSAHATISAAFFFVLIYLMVPHIHSWIKRELFVVGCVLVIILVGLSRIMLNVHWFSDVVAGWALGLFCATASILFIRYVGGIIHKQITK